jgi:hypothetical protein
MRDEVLENGRPFKNTCVTVTNINKKSYKRRMLLDICHEINGQYE